MSRRERDTRVPLDGMTNAQIDIVRHAVLGELIGKAGDLRLLHNHPHPRQAIREVAALGRLAFWLEHGQVRVPDRVALEVARGLAEGVDAMHEWEEVARRHEQAMAEHEAMHSFVAHLSGTDRDADR